MKTEQPEMDARFQPPENPVSVQGRVTPLTSKTPKFNEQHVCETDQQHCNHKNNSSLKQEEPEPLQIKEEQEDFWISKEIEQFIPKQEIDAVMVTSIHEENELREPEPNSEQLLCLTSTVTEKQDEEGSQHIDSGSTESEELKPKKRRLKTRSYYEDATHHHNFRNEEGFLIQQLHNQERNSSLDQRDKHPPHVQKLDEELRHIQEQEHFGLKQVNDTFMVTSSYEDNDSGDHLLFYTSQDTESQDQGVNKTVNPVSSKPEEPKTKKRLHRKVGLSKNVDYSSKSENQCDGDKGEKSVKCSVNEKAFRDKPHVCNICGKKFYRKGHLLVHMRIHTDDKPYSCEICGQSFTQSGNLKAHMRRHTGEKPYSCKLCEKSFTEHIKLKIHMRIHTGEKPYSCEICGQSFTQSGHFKAHMRSHTGEKPYSCKSCEKRFTEHVKLKIHMRTHTGEQPYLCETCGRSFGRRDALKSHTRIHTGEKPYSCEMCGQSFNRHDMLKNHTRIHTGEKPYSCETCGQRFTEYGTLVSHMRSHTGEKPYSCEMCRQSFTLRSNLKTHMKIHTGEKQHSCGKCGETFNRRDTLRTHMIAHTGEAL
ncbi:uncharacterized protein KZ484_000187 isoform 3-T4 [Pholidichthys leucotaenia]